jgi:hypothetical protein
MKSVQYFHPDGISLAYTPTFFAVSEQYEYVITSEICSIEIRG